MPQATSSDLRQQIIEHILKIMKQDIVYARSALRQYVILLPWLDLNEGVKQAMKDAQS